MRPEEKTEAKRQFQQQKFVSKEQRKVRNRIDFLEKEIGKREERMKGIETVLSQPGQDTDVMELTREYLTLKRDLDAFTEEWTTLMEQMES